MQVYGLTETYGHISQCLWQDDWDGLPTGEQARLQAQQGIAFPMVEAVSVIDSETGREVPRDGETQGEIAIRGNTVMKGYYKDADATRTAFKDGWFWSGDAAIQFAEITTGPETVLKIIGRTPCLFQHPRAIDNDGPGQDRCQYQ